MTSLLREDVIEVVDDWATTERGPACLELVEQVHIP